MRTTAGIEFHILGAATENHDVLVLVLNYDNDVVD